MPDAQERSTVACHERDGMAIKAGGQPLGTGETEGATTGCHIEQPIAFEDRVARIVEECHLTNVLWCQAVVPTAFKRVLFNCRSDQRDADIRPTDRRPGQLAPADVAVSEDMERTGCHATTEAVADQGNGDIARDHLAQQPRQVQPLGFGASSFDTAVAKWEAGAFAGPTEDCKIDRLTIHVCAELTMHKSPAITRLTVGHPVAVDVNHERAPRIELG